MIPFDNIEIGKREKEELENYYNSLKPKIFELASTKFIY